MNYNEFKKTYNYMVKKYPDTTVFYMDTEKNVGTVVIENYEKDGRKWVKTDSKIESVSNIYYCNVVDAIPFFKNLGGREIVSVNYTKYGKIPVAITSINPSRTEKTVRIFTFN